MAEDNRAGAPDRDLEGLARVLFEKMEHLDPSNDERTWPEVGEAERQFYRSCGPISIRNRASLAADPLTCQQRRHKQA